jgi:hypothetical protein
MIRARVLNAGAAGGETLILTEALSFWGGFDPLTGKIIDARHPQRGICITGRIVLLRESRGSGTAPGALAEAIRRGTAPSGIILIGPDVNLAIGAAVAARLYDRQCPVLSVAENDYRVLSEWRAIKIDRSGVLSQI